IMGVGASRTAVIFVFLLRTGVMMMHGIHWFNRASVRRMFGGLWGHAATDIATGRKRKDRHQQQNQKTGNKSSQPHAYLCGGRLFDGNTQRNDAQNQENSFKSPRRFRISERGLQNHGL